jgi:hypothetical protein
MQVPLEVSMHSRGNAAGQIVANQRYRCFAGIIVRGEFSCVRYLVSHDALSIRCQLFFLMLERPVFSRVPRCPTLWLCPARRAPVCSTADRSGRHQLNGCHGAGHGNIVLSKDASDGRHHQVVVFGQFCQLLD